MKKLVIIGNIIPEPQSTAAGKRMMQLIDLFANSQYKITFLSTTPASEYSVDLRSKNVDSATILLNDSSFGKILSELHPDIVLFDRFITEEQFGWRVAEVCPNALRILDTEDLHFLRKAREQAYREGKEMDGAELVTDIFKREMASILRSDLSLIISEFEYDLLVKKFSISPEILFYIPLFAEENSCGKSFEQRRNFVSIGNFLHAPNWFTVLKLKDLWPEIKKLVPPAEMHIYGAYPSHKVYQLHNKHDGFLIKGRAEEVKSLFSEMRVLLAPIPFGAGIKGKLLESMQYGLPSVTTPAGAEGMNDEREWNGFIAQNESFFVQYASALYQDEKKWLESQKTGFRITASRFNKNAFVNPFLAKISEILNNLKRHREAHFLGQILLHHTTLSTRYLSRWIELKNKEN